MLNYLKAQLIITLLLFSILLAAQKITLEKCTSYPLSVEKKYDNYGMPNYTTQIYFNERYFLLRLAPNKNKNNIDSIDVVNFKSEESQILTAGIYPFKDSSIVFSIDKENCLFVSKINPFDSSIIVKICKCPISGIADSLISVIPDVLLTDYFTGNNIELRQYINNHKANKVAFHFWSTSCSPCIRELPLINELEKKGYLVINLISTKYSNKEKAEEYLKKFKVKGPQFIGGNDKIGDAFNQSGFPFIILFDQNSNYPYFFSGIEQALEYIVQTK